MTKTNKILSKLRLAFFIFILIFFIPWVFGTVKKMSIEDMTKKASLIVIATVESIKSQWEEADGGKKIFTYVQINIKKYIKGCGEQRVEIKVPGGKVGEITEEVSDIPQFSSGEEIILFLKSDFFQVVGWNQGKYTIQNDKVLGLELSIDDFIETIQKLDKGS